MHRATFAPTRPHLRSWLALATILPALLPIGCAGPRPSAAAARLAGATSFAAFAPADASMPHASTSVPPAPAALTDRTSGGIGAAWIPWATLDVREHAEVPGSTPPADTDEGTGWAVHAGLMQDTFGTDLVFFTTEHDESRTGAELTTYALYIDFVQAQQLWSGPVEGWTGFGLGFGAIRFDWDRTYQSENSGLWQAEGIFGLQIGKHVSLEARASGFLAAHPGRTAGAGALAMLGGTIVF